MWNIDDEEEDLYEDDENRLQLNVHDGFVNTKKAGTYLEAWCHNHIMMAMKVSFDTVSLYTH